MIFKPIETDRTFVPVDRNREGLTAEAQIATSRLPLQAQSPRCRPGRHEQYGNIPIWLELLSIPPRLFQLQLSGLSFQARRISHLRCSHLGLLARIYLPAELSTRTRHASGQSL